MEPRPARIPPPHPDALQRSLTLSERVRREIAERGGWIGFDRYMERVLYEPGLGYYSGGGAKLGASGDFVTAPELGDALARAIATTLEPLLRSLPRPAILELGAGTGALAAQLLETLGRRGIGDVEYRILEVSGELRRRQQAALAAFAGRLTWLDRLPDAPFDGVIVANEVADALPAACFVKRGGTAVPLGVRGTKDGFAWAEGPVQDELADAVLELEAKLGAPLPDLYRSEIRLLLPAWIRALGRSLARGAVLLVDYGYGRRDYYHSQRSGGTLMCHYRHRAHDDPFLYPGLQDITAWVDFSACADAAAEAGLTVAGYTTQAQFVIGALGPELLDGGASVSPQALSALKTLVLPGEMGERFKALLLTKDLDWVLPGRDLRGRL